MHWQRKAGAVLVAAGTLLVAVAVVPTVYGRAMSHLAVVAFRMQGRNESRWDSARIRAYKQTLAVAMDKPEAVLRVPKVGIEVPVYEGTSDLVLNRGAGHVSGTAMPGSDGNVAITGHRDGFFRGLKDVALGDTIDVQRATATDHYVVRAIHTVSPKDISVLKRTDGPTLTLITCYPFYFVGAAPQRYIIEASLLPQRTAAPTLPHLIQETN
jgi:sortase A